MINTVEELTKLPGIGRKTANLVVGDIYHKPAVVCDTHCIRICGRLGFYPEGQKDPLKTERAMEKLEGSYSLLIMSPRKMIAARDPHGFRPLCIGKSEKGIIFASETSLSTYPNAVADTIGA